MASIFEAAPRLFSPAWRFSLGFVFGFYPLEVPLGLRGGLGFGGCLVLSLLAFHSRGEGGQGGEGGEGGQGGEGCEGGEGGEARSEGPARLRRLRLVLAAVLFGGMAVGSLYSAFGFGIPQRPWPDATDVAAAKAATGATVSNTAEGAVPPKLPRLKVAGIAGLLSADSRPARAGQRIMDLSVEKVFFDAPGLRGSYTTKASLRAIVRDGASLAAGARIEVRGRPALDGSPLFFANRRDLLVRSEGNALDRLRNRLHEAFLASILAAVGRSSSEGGTPGSREGATRRQGEAGSAPAAKESEDAAGLLLALLAGWQDELSPEDAAAFKAAGCTHILALSGQHLALIAAGLIFVLRPLVGPLRALLPSFVIVWLYVIVVGPGPSLLRALLSFGIAAIASLSDRPQDGRTILGLCFATHALFFPGQLREAGFVLSYLAVGGLVVLAPRIDYLIAPFVPPPLTAALAASLAAQLATSPWIALSFGIVQPVGILATLATATLVEAVMVGGLVAALIVAIIPIAALVTAPAELFLLRLLEGSMRFFADLPSFPLSEPAARWIGAIAIALIAAFLYAWPHVRLPGRSRQASGAVDGPARI